MEVIYTEQTQGQIACCECGAPITPNPTNMCVGCLRSRVDITDGIPKQSLFFFAIENKFWVPFYFFPSKKSKKGAVWGFRVV